MQFINNSLLLQSPTLQIKYYSCTFLLSWFSHNLLIYCHILLLLLLHTFFWLYISCKILMEGIVQ